MIQLPSEQLAAIEARMTAAAPIVLKATAEVPDDAGGLPDGDVEESSPDGLPVRSRLTK